MGATKKNSPRGGLVAFSVAAVALIAQPADAADGAADRAPVQTAQRDAAAAPVEEVVVTGTRLPTRPTESAQDVQIYDRTRIEESGQTTITKFLQTLPEVSLNSDESTNGATTVRLRGAPQGSTLILINGRRAQAVTGGAQLVGFFDLNMIPLSFVERIEVLPSGSSAIYGGEALDGVVNIVLRSDYKGYEADAGYKWADNTDEKIYSAAAGWTVRGLHATILAMHSDRSPLNGSQRAVTSSSDFRAQGGPNLGLVFFGRPANVSAVSGNLPGLASSFATVPVGSSGIGLTPGSFAATAGMQTTGSFNHYQDLVTRSPRDGIFASANYRVDNDLELFVEMLASSYKLDGQTSPPFLQFANVPGSNPFNPFGVPVLVSGVVQGAESLAHFTFSEDFVRPVVGARGNLGRWQWEVSALYSQDSGAQIIYGQPNTAQLNAALASGALNPFIDGPMASPAVLASIFSNTLVTNYTSDATILDGFLRGSLAELPAGPLDIVLGTEFENSSMQVDFTRSRDARALFTELRAPIFSAGAESGGRRDLLALTAAGRYDNYSDFGDKATWQVGLDSRPVSDLLLRATHATAFKPPTLSNLGSPQSPSPITVNDPHSGGTTTLAQQIIGGNGRLDPITGTSSTAGAVWTPRAIRGLNLSTTYWQMRIDNGIISPSPQFIVDNEALFPGRVVRDSSGRIASVDRTFINFGTIQEKGIDAAASWRFSTAIGDLTPGLAATYMLQYSAATTPGGPVISRLSHAQSDGVFAPRLKGLATLVWEPDLPFKLALDGRYTGSYSDYNPTPTRKLGNFWYWDATGEVDVKRALKLDTPLFPAMKLQVSALNLANKLPPFSSYFRGYDVFNYDLLGRTIFVRLRVQS